MAIKIQLRRGTASEWTSANPVLMQGEMGVETDTLKVKLGNGTTAWTSLPYFTQGAKGDTGPTGATGPTGPTGATGATGATGPANTITMGTVTTGAAGSSASATVTGTAPNQTLNLVIPKGDKGDTGTAATITVGTVTALSPGATPTVSNSGTTGAAVFNFGIPTGATGATGPANSLSVGTVTSGASASATITGSAPSQTLNLVLPKGDTGATGTTGATGATGPANSLSIGTVSSGTTASATITGTPPAQTLNLVLPKGDTGATGATGATGPQGADGIPAGSIMAWVTNTAPTNWLFADGTAISRTTYSTLFAVIGTTYGAGNGSTTFNLPNLSGRVPVGKNAGTFATLAATGGAESVSLDSNNLPAHTHSFSATTSTDGSHTHAPNSGYSWLMSNRTAGTANGSGSAALTDYSTSTGAAGSHAHTVSGTTGSSGAGTAHNNLQPYIVLNYIIKT